MKMITKKWALWVIVGLAICAVSTIESCKKSSSSTTVTPPPPPPPSGPTSSSDSVEPQALKLHWAFDGTPNDSVLGLQGTAVGGSYVTGVLGKAWQGSSTSYITVPTGTDSTTLGGEFGSYSVSVWYQLPTAVRPTSGGTAQGIFFMSGENPGADGNEFILEADIASANQLATDSVPIHNGFNNVGGPAGSWQGFTLATYDTTKSTWVNIVMTYNGASSQYVFYQNGTPLPDQSAFGYETPDTLYDGPLPLGSGSPATQLMGNLVFAPDNPQMFYIGCWPPGLYGVSQTLGANGNFQGALDELRVWNIALTKQDVVYLYQDGSAGK
jgi:hypothetical protein